MMTDMLAAIFAEEVARLIVGLAIAILTVLTGIALDALRRWLGEARTEALRARLDEAITRALAAATARGVTEETVTEWVASYIERTLSGTVRSLAADPEALRHRIGSQIAASRGLK